MNSVHDNMWALANAVAVTAVVIELAVAAATFCHVSCQHLVASDLCLEVISVVWVFGAACTANITLKKAA